jgi:ABC-type multidrug transport system fused ATPase/permease subunit
VKKSPSLFISLYNIVPTSMDLGYRGVVRLAARVVPGYFVLCVMLDLIQFGIYNYTWMEAKLAADAKTTSELMKHTIQGVSTAMCAYVLDIISLYYSAKAVTILRKFVTHSICESVLSATYDDAIASSASSVSASIQTDLDVWESFMEWNLRVPLTIPLKFLVFVALCPTVFKIPFIIVIIVMIKNIPPLFLRTWMAVKYVKPNWRLVVEARDTWTMAIEEYISRPIRARLNLSNDITVTMLADDWSHKYYSYSGIMARTQVCAQGLNAILTYALQTVMLWMIIEGRMTIGQFIMVQAAEFTLAGYAHNISGFIEQHQRLSGQLKRLSDLLRLTRDPILAQQRLKPSMASTILPDLQIKLDVTDIGNINTYHLKPGCIYVLKGPSGCGKSTFIRRLLGCHGVARELTIEQGVTPNDINYYSLFSYTNNNTPVQRRLQTEGDHNLWCIDTDFPSQNDMLSYLLQLMHVHKVVDRVYDTYLSEGERQRVAFCQDAVGARNIWIMDEPFSSLDAESVVRAVEMLRRFRGIILIASHNTYLQAAADVIIKIGGGSPRGRGPPCPLTDICTI